MAMRHVLPTGVMLTLALVLIATPALAQDAPAAQDAPDAEKRTDFEGSVEVLYRGVGQSGSDQKYREDFDGLSSGLRLSNLQASWQNVDSGIADYFRIEAGGLGGDPYEHAALRLGRRDVYDLELTHSRQVYLYDLFELAGDTDGSTWDTTRSIADIELTLHATEHIDFFVEYSENRRDGTTLFMKDVRTDLFRMETPLDQEVERYTVGGKFDLGPATLVVRQSLRNYDRRFNNTTRGDSGLNTGDAVTLTDYDWRQTDDGTTDLTTLSLATPLGERVHLSVTAFGTIAGDDELTSDAVVNATGTTAGGAFTLSNGTSHTTLDTDHLALDADLTFKLAETLDFMLQVTTLDREIEGTQLRDLNGNGSADDTQGTVFDATPGSTTREDYSLQSYTGLFDYSPTRALRLRAGYRTIDRELERGGFEFGTNDNRNDRFESDGDDTLVLGVKLKAAAWVDLHADYEEGDITQAFTAVSPMESDRLRLRANLKPTEKLRIDLTHTDYENSNRGSDFRGTASCASPAGDIDDGCWNSRIEGTTAAVALWHQPHQDFDYQLRWAKQEVDSVVRVLFDTELFFNSTEIGDSIYDSDTTQWSGQANIRWSGNWKAFVRGQLNDADGDNSLIGPAFRNTLLIDQDYLDLELGITHTLKSGVYLGGRLRHFDYDDARRQFAYDGEILTLVAGLSF